MSASEWKSVKAKWLFSNKSIKNHPNEPQLSASQKYGVIPQAMLEENMNSRVMAAMKSLENFKLVEKNDFVISLRSFQGGIEHSNHRGIISPAYTVMTPSELIHPNFFRYVLKEVEFIVRLNSVTIGIRDGKTITYDDFGQLELDVPPIKQQIEIAQILDEKIEQIDKNVQLLEDISLKLEQKRLATITQAVTKGFDSNVSMKNSGIEWIGKIPEHWEIIPLKRDFEVQLGKMLQNEPKSDTDTHEYYLKSANIQWDGVSLTPQVKMWFSESEKEKYLLKKGDLLVSEGGDVGCSCLYNDEYERCYIQNAINRVRPTGKVTTEYLYYFMKAMHHSGFVEIICNKSTIPHFTAEKVAEVRYARPPINEISQIVESLNNACGQIAESITLIENKIIKLKEYRTALISAAVTGKIDVRSL